MDEWVIAAVIIALITGVSTIYVNHFKKNTDDKKSIKKSFNWNFFNKINVKQ